MRQTTALAFVLLSFLAAAQEGKSSGSLTVLLPSEVPSETAQISYFLQGSFGLHGDLVSPGPKVESYLIRTAINGKPAKTIQLVLWARGCQTKIFNLKLVGSPDTQVPFVCDPLAAVILTGRIQPGDGARDIPSEISIRYSASWECRFYGLVDCLVPQIDLGVVKPDAQGLFEIELPDFHADPVPSRFETDDGGSFSLILRHQHTLNRIAQLQPSEPEYRTPGGDLKVLSTYPSNLNFVTPTPKESEGSAAKATTD
jgi:hypothetical protein